MTRSRPHREHHRVSRVGWLRAAILGANDGVVSTASLLVGVAAAAATPSEVMIAGVAGLTAGALSMAAGEYVSVSAQSDAEQADLDRERTELMEQPAFEREELAQIYVARGLDPDLARQVAMQLMAKDALGAHALDELGISEIMAARPLQAALTSAMAFATGAALPLGVAAIAPPATLALLVATASLGFLASLGAMGAWAGGATLWKAALRMTVWGAAAMTLTAGVGALVGAAL